MSELRSGRELRENLRLARKLPRLTDQRVGEIMREYARRMRHQQVIDAMKVIDG